MTTPRASLTPVRFKFIGKNPQRRAGIATVAIRSVGEHATASEPFTDQFGVGGVIDQVARCCHLRPGLFSRQVAAWIGRCRIELQGLQWKILELSHEGVDLEGNNSRQYTGSNCQ